MDAPTLQSYIGAMFRRTCRRAVALAVAYAVALNLLVPLLAALASAVSAAPAPFAELCVAEQGGAGSDADRPGRHGSACPLGPGCQMRDCGANALLAVNPENARSSVIVPAAGLLSVRLERETLTLRAIGAQSARAPPRA
ncbi:MAG: hypothetical protein ACXU9D_06170 [Xanthobacteraceae bacterium]